MQLPLLTSLLCVAAVLQSSYAAGAKLRDAAAGIAPWIVAVRRELHSMPELGYAEFNTSAKIREYLEELKIPYNYPVAITGVVATIGTGDGPTVALRSDIDALPVQEPEGLPYASKVRSHTMLSHLCCASLLIPKADV